MELNLGTFLSVLTLGPLLNHISSVEAVAPYMRTVGVSTPCPRNKYFVTSANSAKRCSRCSECPEGHQVQKKCSAYNNTICEPCPSGWYNDVTGSKCKPCSGCKLGEYIRRSCTAKRDTKCHKCPRDTYSLSANVTACLRCKRCRKNEKIISKCNRSRDTVCGDCLRGHFRESSTGSCLRCSPCPHKLQHIVVPECRKRLGMHHSNICWPGKTRLRFKSAHEDDTFSKDITEEVIEVELEDYTYFWKSFTLIPVILGSILSCVIVLISVFIIIHFTKCKQCRKCTRWLGFGNDETFDIASITSRESIDDDHTLHEDRASVGTGSVNSNDGFYSDFEMESVSMFANESLPSKMKVTSSDSVTSNRNSLLDYDLDVSVRM